MSYKFGDGTVLGGLTQATACEVFDVVIEHAYKEGSLPYFVGKNDMADDLAAGLVSVVACVTAITEQTGGIPVNDMILFSDCERGYIDLALKGSLGNGEPEDWGALARYAQSAALLDTATQLQATHVFIVSYSLTHLSNPDGSITTGEAVPLLKFVGWDVRSGAGLRWFARVGSTGKAIKPFRIYPWHLEDKDYDWKERIESLGRVLPVGGGQLGDYFMSVLQPGIEVIGSLDDAEPIAPTHVYVRRLAAQLARLGQYVDVRTLAQQAADELALQDDRFDVGVDGLMREMEKILANADGQKGKAIQA